MKIFKILKSLEEQIDSQSIEQLPRYIEMGYSIFRGGFSRPSEEESRWAFLLWAYEDEKNGIYKDIRADEYVKKLFSQPHEFYLANGNKVLMHEYHYRYFVEHMKSFKGWGFESLDKDPLRYLEWFYQYGEKKLHYADVSMHDFWLGSNMSSPLSIMDMPPFLLNLYIRYKKGFSDSPLEEESRWAFLLWAYEDEKNGIYKDIRANKYVKKLFSQPHEFYLANGNKVLMHEYHYRYFVKHMKSFKGWGFESLDKDPLRYLEWFYTEGIYSKLPYALITKEFFSDLK